MPSSSRSRAAITLTLMRDAESGRLSAEVQDTGPGIEASELVHVFEAFRQVGGAASRPFEGTGLGLTIARDIAQAMGGDISMRSTVGVGTCALFTALLPSAAAPEVAATSQSAGDAGRRRRLARADRRGRRRQRGHCHGLSGAHGRHCGAGEGRPPGGAPCAAGHRPARHRADGLPHADDGRHGGDARDPQSGAQPGVASGCR